MLQPKRDVVTQIKQSCCWTASLIGWTRFFSLSSICSSCFWGINTFCVTPMQLPSSISSSHVHLTFCAWMQGGGAAGAAVAAPSEMDFATVLATFSPELREEVLLTSEEDLINSLPPALLAEAQALRQRVMQAYRFAPSTTNPCLLFPLPFFPPAVTLPSQCIRGVIGPNPNAFFGTAASNIALSISSLVFGMSCV